MADPQLIKDALTIACIEARSMTNGTQLQKVLFIILERKAIILLKPIGVEGYILPIDLDRGKLETFPNAVFFVTVHTFLNR